MLHNTGSAEQRATIEYERIFVLDAAVGKKYEVLRDDRQVPTAATSSGFRTS